MRSPQKYLQAVLGDLKTIEVLGREIDLHAEVGIPDDEDMEAILADHPIRVAAWKRIVAKCRHLASDAHDHVEELKAERFLAYWAAKEEQEREELTAHGRDETAERDTFNRPVRGRARINEGRIISLGRWRRNFSDDYIWGCVRSDPKVVEARKQHRELKEQLELAEVVVDALEHRARCLSHLAAYHRDQTK